MRTAAARWLVLVGVACAALPAAARAEAPPVVTGAVVSPSSLPESGGVVTVTADVTDDTGPVEVYADVYGPYWFTTALSAGGPTPDSWTGTIELPANFDAEPVSWTVDVRARDLDQQETTELAGEVSVAGTPPFDEPPAVFDPAVTPPSLAGGGGPVTLAVSATDLRGISEAHATVTPAGGTPVTVPLTPVSADRFEGVFTAPANATSSPVRYTTAFSASDDIGQITTIAGPDLTVAARPAPPSGKLEIRPKRHDFGTVRAGHRAVRRFVVKNTGRTPAKGVVRTSGAPFHVVGDRSFELRPGKSATAVVEFRPTAPGRHTGRLTVVRSDGGPAVPAAALTGRGARRRVA